MIPSRAGHLSEEAAVNRKSIQTAKRLYTVLLILFMYAPIFAMIALSFNASKFRAVWGGFTLDWYQRLIHDHVILSAVQPETVAHRVNDSESNEEETGNEG